ncbi:MAG: Nramp family divalent metal transporter [Flavobacteriaceae bacterium]|nr:Nramp family divalent metal transporter [Flavobacteriaceae bacterium]MDZ4147648.1 Nramp family divalent metal transporter [Flavobacteriaceae bacterium]
MKFKINFFKHLGPGSLVAAAFIGPGTVTVCSVAGVDFGFGLLWALTLSIVATIVLQEMAARLGLITQNGLAENIKMQFQHPLLRFLALLLLFSAIVIGNAAYEAGNIRGAVLGLQSAFDLPPNAFYPIGLGLLVMLLLFSGSYRFLEKLMVTLVILMSLSFVLTAILTRPSLADVFKGIFIPSFPDGSMLMIIALVGTTTVPYNLFLHAALVKEKWKKETDLKAVRRDSLRSILLGGLVSISIVIAAAASQLQEVTKVTDLAEGLTPLYGSLARYFLGFGLFAAGITSSMTAPLAAAFVARGCFGWEADMKNYRFRLVWMIIVLIGMLFASLQINPIELITFAQVTNGLLLPVVAVFLWWVVNKTDLMGIHKNTLLQNILTFLIILVALLLGLRSIFKVF